VPAGRSPWLAPFLHLSPLSQVVDPFLGSTASSVLWHHPIHPPCVPDVRLSPSPAGLSLTCAVDNEVSRFSMQFRGVPPPGSRCDAATARCLPLQTTVSATSVRGSLTRRCPFLRFGAHLTMRNARPGVRMDSLLLSCRTLSFLIACRLIPDCMPVYPGAPSAHGCPYSTSNSLAVFHLPFVKSGNSTGALPPATDFSVSGEITLLVTES